MAHVFAFGSGLVISHAHKRTALVIDNIPASHPRWIFNAAVSVCQRGWKGLDWAGIRRRGLETNQTSTRKMYLSSLVAHVRGKRVAAEWRGGGEQPPCANLHICRAPRNVKQVKTWVKLRLPFLFSAVTGLSSLSRFHYTWPARIFVCAVGGYMR